jgi:hypothetical protein
MKALTKLNQEWALVYRNEKEIEQWLSEAEQQAGIPGWSGWGKGYLSRDTYFNIPDIALRKRLIGCTREITNQANNRQRIEWETAQQRVAVAKVYGRYAYYFAGFNAAALTIFGSVLFGIPGAIAGAVAGYFLGHARIEAARVERLQRIARCEEHARFYNKGLLGYLFSENEANTGEPDPDTTEGMLKGKTEAEVIELISQMLNDTVVKERPVT